MRAAQRGEPGLARAELARLNARDRRIYQRDLQLWREQSPTVFFITHSIEEAVYLGDTILIFSSSPGTVLKEYKIDPPTRPSLEMQRDPKFLETVFEIRSLIEKLESSKRAGD